jgi:putative phosphoribosyl transferase
LAGPFKDRYEAGRQLAELLMAFANRTDTIVLALPRGGVPVGYEVSVALNAPLDVFMVRKLGAPGREELAMGAIASGGEVVLNEAIVRACHISPDQIQRTIASERMELSRRERYYRDGQLAPSLVDRIVLLVDDGLATGSTMRAAATAIRKQRPSQIVVAVPVSDPDVCEELNDIVDKTICKNTPEPFYAVGLWYEDFAPTSDDEVRKLLQVRQDAFQLHSARSRDNSSS